MELFVILRTIQRMYRAAIFSLTRHHIFKWRLDFGTHFSQPTQADAASAFKHLSVVFNTYQLSCK
jgi:hypothetical protein